MPIEFQQKMRRKKFGRQFKLIADLALMLGSNVTRQQEANQGIEVAIQEMKTQNDFSWFAYGHETKAACALAKRVVATGSQVEMPDFGMASTLGSIVSNTGSQLRGMMSFDSNTSVKDDVVD